MSEQHQHQTRERGEQGVSKLTNPHVHAQGNKPRKKPRHANMAQRQYNASKDMGPGADSKHKDTCLAIVHECLKRLCINVPLKMRAKAKSARGESALIGL